LGPELGVNQKWAKRSVHAPKCGCVDVYNVCPKRFISGYFFMFDLLPFFSPSFLVTTETFTNNSTKTKQIIIYIYMIKIY
jgi:hypothetical protein